MKSKETQMVLKLVAVYEVVILFPFLDKYVFVVQQQTIFN